MTTKHGAENYRKTAVSMDRYIRLREKAHKETTTTTHVTELLIRQFADEI